jgi:hypothetical protein
MAANAAPKLRTLSQKFRPLLDRILVIKDEPLTKTKGERDVGLCNANVGDGGVELWFVGIQGVEI